MLLKFEYNDILFCANRINGKFTCYVIENDITNYNLTSEQVNIFNNVIKSFIPSGKRIKLMDYTYGDKTYIMSLDLKNKFHYFEPAPDMKTFKKLNYMFNNVNEYVYSTTKFENVTDNAYIKRIIKLGKTAIIAFASASLIYQLMVAIPYEYINYKEYKIQTEIDYNVALSSMNVTNQLSDTEFIKIIKDSINKNSNLTYLEKHFILSDLTIFLDNKQYMDIEYLKNTFSNMKINYTLEDNGHIEATYNQLENEITFYEASNIYDVEIYTFTHEFLHATQKSGSFDDNSFLIETTNTIFNNEYLYDESNLYTHYYNLTKALMELVGSEPLKQFHNYTSERPIIDALCEIIDNENYAKKLLTNLNDYKKIYDNMYFIENKNSLEYEIQFNDLNNLKADIFEQFKIYYYQKYGIDMEDDLIMLYYLDANAFRSKIYELYDLKADPIYYINNITYFNKNKTNEKKGIVIKRYITDNIKTEIIDKNGTISQNKLEEIENIAIITDENRYLNIKNKNYSNNSN